MSDTLFRLLLGHLVGDYVAGQNDWMALNKKKAWTPCVVHCLLYTFWVCLFLSPELMKLPHGRKLAFAGLIFASHILVDRSQVIEWWMILIKGLAYKRIDIRMLWEEPKTFDPGQDNPEAQKRLKREADARLSRFIFTCIVQTMADNTAHLLLMYLLVRLCF